MSIGVTDLVFIKNSVSQERFFDKEKAIYNEFRIFTIIIISK